MKTTRRRAASPVLRWNSFGHNQQYRITVRDEDTGEARIVYEGFRQECRLPADFRLTPNLLSMRVYSRSADDPAARYTRRLDSTALLRLGDDFVTPSADLLVGREAVGATAYRFLLRDALSQDILVDIVSSQPRFLLAPGQVQGRAAEWAIKPFVTGKWRWSRWSPVTGAAVEAAVRRAEKPIVVEEFKVPASWPAQRAVPAVAVSSAPEVARSGVALVVPVTALPVLAPQPTGESVLATQWIDGVGGGAVHKVATMLEQKSLAGWFFIDVELGAALDLKTTERLLGRLRMGGHKVGLLIAGDSLSSPGVTRQDRLARMLEILGAEHSGEGLGVMIVEGSERENWLDVLAGSRASGLGLIASRGALLGLSPWMHWRTAPFAADEKLVVFPTATFLSTPAHHRDRVVRHVVGNRDALAAGSATETIAAMAGMALPFPALAEIDPLLLLDRRRSRDRAEADLWNNTLRQALPNWLKAGWRRSSKGFDVARGISEIQEELLARFIHSIAQATTPALDWEALFHEGRMKSWLDDSLSWEPVLEQRRGPRQSRLSTIRRYDGAYRAALEGGA